MANSQSSEGEQKELCFADFISQGFVSQAVSPQSSLSPDEDPAASSGNVRRQPIRQMQVLPDLAPFIAMLLGLFRLVFSFTEGKLGIAYGLTEDF